MQCPLPIDILSSACFAKDNEVYSQWWHVTMLLAPPTDLYQPWVLLRVATAMLLDRFGLL